VYSAVNLYRITGPQDRNDVNKLNVQYLEGGVDYCIITQIEAALVSLVVI
jgi:hypothetical protein